MSPRWPDGSAGSQALLLISACMGVTLALGLSAHLPHDHDSTADPVTTTAPLNPILNTPKHHLVFGAESSTLRALRAHERVAGRQLNAVRIYRRWGQPLYQNLAPEEAGSDELQMVQNPADRLLFVSVAAQYPNGRSIPWARIASASRTSTGKELAFYNNIVSMALQIEQFVRICTYGGSLPGSAHMWPSNGRRDPGCQVYFTFNHEPEQGGSRHRGTSVRFVAAWRNIWNIFQSKGVCSVSNPKPAAACLALGGAMIKYVWIVTSWGFQRTDRYNVQNYYPGNKYVDIVGADAYNWYTCHKDDWQSMAYVIEFMRRWGARHPTKPLVLTEWNTVEDPAQLGIRKASWIDKATRLFTEPGYQQFWGVLNWGESPSDSRCDFGYDSSRQAAGAWAQMGAKPAYAGTTIPILLSFKVSGSMVAGSSVVRFTAHATLPDSTTYPGWLPRLKCTFVEAAGRRDIPISSSLRPGRYIIDPTSCTSSEPRSNGVSELSYAVADYGNGVLSVVPAAKTRQHLAQATQLR